jgi:WhiB family redox-sensing transcriptional regulator
MLTPENQDLASCNIVSDPDLFFPDPTDREGIDKAKRICAGCPIAFDCLETAMADSDLRKWGIWGGTTPEERKTMLRTPRTRLRIFAEAKETSERVALAIREVSIREAGRKLPSYNKNTPYSL